MEYEHHYRENQKGFSLLQLIRKFLRKNIALTRKKIIDQVPMLYRSLMMRLFGIGLTSKENERMSILSVLAVL